MKNVTVCSGFGHRDCMWDVCKLYLLFAEISSFAVVLRDDELDESIIYSRAKIQS